MGFTPVDERVTSLDLGLSFQIFGRMFLTLGSREGLSCPLITTWWRVGSAGRGEAGQTWQAQAYSEGLLGTSGRALCQGCIQRPLSRRALTSSGEGWRLYSHQESPLVRLFGFFHL
ncbi:hypothetical protein CHARACLAT_033474, partial [Characodon lateralis]|nr:hypothetical protein [Characodon lateralis]